MSYILDALKKADRQRHLAQVPTVATVHRTPAKGSRRPWLWIVAAVVILVNATVLGWLLRPTAMSPTSDPNHATQMASTVPDSPPPALTPAAPAEPRAASPTPPLPGAGKATPPTARAETVTPPRSAAIDRKVAAAKPADPKPAAPAAQAPAAQSASATPPPVAPPSVSQAPTASPAQAPTSRRGPSPPAAQPAPAPKPAAGAAVTAPATDKPGPSPTRTTPAETSSPATAATQAPNPADRVAAATPSTPPREGFASGQDVLPQMHLQMLVYSDVPSERLVFINNQKYVEGQSVEGKAVVETITPEGAMVSYQGKRVLLRAEVSATR